MRELAILREWGRRRAVWGVFVVGVAWVVAQISLQVSSTSVDELETVAGLAAIGWLATRRALVCLCVVGALAMFGWNPLLLQVGSIDLRLLDVPIIVLFARVVLDRSAAAGLVEGRKYIVALLVLTGLATLYVAGSASENFADAAASWTRLAVTASLIWLTAAALRSRRDFTIFLRIVILAAICAVGYGVYQVVSLGESGARARAFGGPNALGLMAGMLILAGLQARVLPSRETRFATVVIGIVGLVMSKSIASITGTGIAIIIGGVGTWSVHRARRSRTTDAAVRTWGRIIVGAVIVFTLVSAIRPVDLPGSEGFGHSSAAIRLSVGYAGLEIWQAHPVIGVGWQQSSTDGVINAPSVVEAVENQFGEDFRTYLEAGGEGVTTVHNMYIQFLAETGLIGFGVLVWLLIGLARIVLRWVRTLEDDPWWGPNVRFLSLVLLLELVWWNDNALFGSQPESLLAAITLGLLIAGVRIAGQEHEAELAAAEAPADESGDHELASQRANPWRSRLPAPRSRTD